MVRDHGRAEDVTQEVFMSALRRMRATDTPIAFKAWVYEIAKNACIDAFRRSRRVEEVSFDADDASERIHLASNGPTPDAAVDTRMSLENLQGAFGGLSDAHHQILVMRELEGLSYRQIGERLGMSRASVESTLFRARRRLSAEYEDLVSGERCRRVQATIAQADDGGRLGARDARRMARHVSHCQPCRRAALAAGLDVAPRRTAREKIAALLPLPAFFKRRFGGGADDHGAALAKWSATAAHYADPSTGGWNKAAAVVAAMAVAGAGVGVATHGSALGLSGSPARSAPARAPAAKSTAARTHKRTVAAGPTARRTGPSRVVGARSQARPKAGPQARSGGAAAGAKHAAAGGSSSSGGSAAAQGAKPASGAAGTVKHTVDGAAGGASTSTGAVGGAVSGAGKAVGNTTKSVGQAVSKTTGAAGGAVSGATGAVGGTASGATGAVGGAVSGATGAVGGAVSGATGGSGAGGAVGGTVGGVGGAVGGTVGGVGGAVGGTVGGVGGAVGGTVGGVGGAVGGTVGGVGGPVGGAVGGVGGAVGGGGGIGGGG
jgi:RNA polymerase sigma factor (sigma-70 family)